MLAVPVVNTYFPVIRFPEPATPLTVCGLPINVSLEKKATVPVGALPKLGRAAVPNVRFAVRVTLPPDAMLVASGQVEIWIEPHASPWDFAPLKVIVEEAGGRFLNFDGGSSIYAGNCIVCAPAFEDEVVGLLGLAR